MKMFRTIAAFAAVAAVLPVAAMASTGGAILTASLNGANEVPNPGDADGFGRATVRVNVGARRVCYNLSVTNIVPSTVAHIHRATAGNNGGVVVGLIAPTSGSSQGCATVSRELAMALIQNPENYYVNVHNSDFPGGAVRGQLGL